jgi:hypothetical protein
VIYGGVRKSKDGKELEPIDNLIKLNDFFILVPLTVIVCILTLWYSFAFIAEKFPFWVFMGYFVVVLPSTLEERIIKGERSPKIRSSNFPINFPPDIFNGHHKI